MKTQTIIGLSLLGVAGTSFYLNHIKSGDDSFELPFFGGSGGGGSSPNNNGVIGGGSDDLSSITYAAALDNPTTETHTKKENRTIITGNNLRGSDHVSNILNRPNKIRDTLNNMSSSSGSGGVSRTKKESKVIVGDKFQGPVRPTDDLNKFRRTGETKPLFRTSRSSLLGGLL